ncbi:MAG: dockerin type I domain-containing protein [Pirellulales bacterium]
MRTSSKRARQLRRVYLASIAAGQLESLEERWCPAVAPQLLADINPVAFPSGLMDPKDLVSSDNKLYFVATAEASDLSTAIWESDGTEAGTQIVTRPGLASRPFTVGGKLLYFGENNRLYAFDGQTSTMLVNNNAGALPQHVQSWTEQSIGLFTYRSGGGISGLWRTDGNKDGTTQLLSGDVASPFYWDHKALVTRLDLKAAQLETWITDGTAEGTVRLAAWKLPPNTSYSPDLISYYRYGSQVYFNFPDSIHGTELWRTDGTPAGTRLLWDITPGKDSSQPGEFATLSNRLYFFASTYSGRQLYSTDGTAAGMRAERELLAGGLGITARQFMTVAGRLLIVGAPGAFGASSLWVSDGTFAGTVPQALDDAGRWNDAPADHNYSILGVVGDRVLLARSQNPMSQGNVRYDLWWWDVPTGSVAKVVTPQLKSLAVLPDALPELVGGRLAMQLSTPQAQLFVISDGTAEGTQVLDGFRQLELTKAVRHGNRIYFPAQRDELTNLTVWSWDGSTATPQLLKHVPAPTPGSGPGTFARLGDATYFLAQPRQVASRQLFRTDGTAAGTVAISDPIANTPGYSEVLIAGDNVLFFSVGVELWRSDGTPAGTSRVAITKGVDRPFMVGDRLYFYGGGDPATGGELWTSDGTAAGTVLVRDLAIGPNSSDVVPLGKWQQLLVFSFYLGAGNRSLWVTDGTSAGTRRIFDFLGGQAETVVAMSEQMLFATGRILRRLDPVTRQWHEVELPADFTGTFWVEPIAGGALIAETPYADGVQRWRLWRVSDTGGLEKIAEGTEQDQGGFSFVRAVDAVTQQVIFLANSGRTVWRTDGTAAGTQSIAEMTPARFPTIYHRFLIAEGGQIYGVANQTVWQIDQRGLTAIDSPIALQYMSASDNLLLRGSQLYFKAVDPLFGIEPYVWTVPLGDPPVASPGALTGNGRPDAASVAGLASDANFDGRVDALDLAELLAAWTGSTSLQGNSPADRAWADLDGDGDVDSADLLILMSDWTPPPATDSPEA